MTGHRTDWEDGYEGTGKTAMKGTERTGKTAMKGTERTGKTL